MNNTFTRAQLGWKPALNSQIPLEDLMTCFPARVAEVHRNRLVLWSESGVHDISLAEHTHLTDRTVGDWLLLPFEDEPGSEVKTIERFSLFARKSPHDLRLQAVAANVDTGFIVTSCNHDFNLSRLERYLAVLHEAGVTPVVVITKTDLVDEDSKLALQQQLHQLGPLIEGVFVNATEAESCEQLSPWCQQGQTVVLLGSSGVGKTTLTNTLCDTHYATAGIREDDSKGRHTTTSRSLHHMPTGGIILDCPGMRELQLSDCEQGVNQAFDDISALAEQCRFKDCQHDQEPGCAVQQAVAVGQLDPRRLANYHKLMREQARNSQTLAEAHKQDRQFGKMVRNAMSDRHFRRQQK